MPKLKETEGLLLIRMDKTDLAIIKELAKEQDRTMTNWCRKIIKDRLREQSTINLK